MSQVVTNGYCYCGLKQAYAHCCGRFHHGALAPDPESLMRSRFSAFVMENADYQDLNAEQLAAYESFLQQPVTQKLLRDLCINSVFVSQQGKNARNKGVYV